MEEKGKIKTFMLDSLAKVLSKDDLAYVLVRRLAMDDIARFRLKFNDKLNNTNYTGTIHHYTIKEV